ncbi:MAG: hypothetical protein ABF381_15845 [Akkermansiaceae bacterium]
MSNKKTPLPSGIKPPQPGQPGQPPSKFRFHKPFEKPKNLTKSPSVKDEFLHIFCISVLGIIFFAGGMIYLLLRRPWVGSSGIGLILGGLLGIGLLYRLCKRED